MLDFFLNLSRETAALFTEASLYLLFGFFIAGLIHAYFPEEKILKYFGPRNLRSVFNASLLGIPLPLCSCAVIPTAVSLRKSGASRGATISFLISTPETGVDSIGVSFALLDPLMSIFRPLSALITAMTAGLGASLLERRLPPETPPTDNGPDQALPDACGDGCSHVDPRDGKSPLRRALAYSFGELLDDLAPWLVIGFIAAALIAVIIPDGFFAGFLGQGIWPMLLMLLIGIPLYICASASTPIAAALILKGLSPGAALVFLLTGPATNIGSLILLSRYFERRFLILYLATIAACSLALGALLNAIYASLNLDVRATLGSGAELIPGPVKIVAALVVVALLHRSLVKTNSYRKIWGAALAKTRWSRRKLLTWISLLAAVVYLGDGFFMVPAGQTGMILSFGRVIAANLPPGLHYRAPRPFANQRLVATAQIRSIQIGFRSEDRPLSAQNVPKIDRGEKLDVIASKDVPEESEILAGDENLVDIDLSVFYSIADAYKSTYRVGDLQNILHNLTSAELLNQIAARPVWDGLIGGKGDVIESLRRNLQVAADNLQLGVAIHDVNLIYAHAPNAVHSSFREVASGLEDKYRLINLAQSDSISTLASARAQDVMKINNAQADSARSVRGAWGDSARFVLFAKSLKAHRAEQQFRLNAEVAESTLVRREKILMLAPGALDLILIPQADKAQDKLPPEVLQRLQNSITSP